MTREELASRIADHGGWEVFHQKRYEYEMYDYHKARRLQLEAEYMRKFGNAKNKNLQ